MDKVFLDHLLILIKKWYLSNFSLLLCVVSFRLIWTELHVQLVSHLTENTVFLLLRETRLGLHNTLPWVGTPLGLPHRHRLLKTGTPSTTRRSSH